MSLADTYLKQAWKSLAPGADTSRGFPRGFWPDVARVAVEMALQETLEPELNFRPTRCERGSGLEAQSAKKTKAKSRAENTAALLAQLQGAKK